MKSLPVGTARKRRPRRSAWVLARQYVQFLALAAFVLLLLLAKKDTPAASALELLMQSDPLLVLAHALASRMLLATSALGLVLVVLTVIFGRAWCGWLCPLGTLLDWIPLRRLRLRAEPAQGWRRVKFDLVLLILIAALLGNLSLLFLDPLTLLTRFGAVAFLPALDRLVSALEGVLYRLPGLSAAVATFDSWVRPAVLPFTPLHYREALLTSAVLLGVILLNLFAERFWCRYLCPLGGLLGLISRVAVFQRRVDQDCGACKLCTQACPTGTIDARNAHRSDPAECTLCMQCVESCPRGLNSFRPAAVRPIRQDYDPQVKDALVVAGAALLGVALLKSLPRASTRSQYLLRPPGVEGLDPDPAAFSHCVRCGTCMRVCPTGALQPLVGESGLDAIGTPVLIPRLGYCDHACNACGQSCPVQAIPPLSLPEKRLQVIGKAFIDEGRCLPWAEQQECFVCEEMCPLPQKAIRLDPVQVMGEDGSPLTLKQPVVIRSLCIGCGICETKCPLEGEAAIRIRVHGRRASRSSGGERDR